MSSETNGNGEWDEQSKRAMDAAEKSMETAYNTGGTHEPGMVDRGSVLRTQVNFTTDSLKAFWLYKLVLENGKQIKLLIGLGIGLLFITAFFRILFAGATPDDIWGTISVLFLTVWKIIANFLGFIINTLFINPWTAVPLWSYTGVRLFYTYVLSKEHSIFAVLWMDDYKTLRVVMFPKYYDTAGRPYLGGKADWLYRFIYGNPRIPFHEDLLKPFVDFLNISIEHVGEGAGVATLYSGNGVILETNPKNNIDDNFEAAEIFRYVDVPSEEEGYVYRYCILDLDQIIPVSIWASMLAGIDLEYWKKYMDSERKVSLLERELVYQKYDGSMKAHKEYFPTMESLREEYAEDELIDEGEYREFDDIKKQLTYRGR